MTYTSERIATLEAELEQCLALLKAIHDGYPADVLVPAWIAERIGVVPSEAVH